MTDPATPPTNDNAVPATAFDDAVRDMTTKLKDALETFKRTAGLLTFPRIDAGEFAFFQTVLQLVAMRDQGLFYHGVTVALMELLERTRADNGGLDPRAIQREMTQRNIAAAMGPDPEILQHLVRGSNHAQSIQDQEIAALRGIIEQVRSTLMIVMGLTDLPLDIRDALQVLRETLETPTKDPGAMPEGVRTDGGL